MNQSIQNSELTFVENEFGTVTNKRVMYYRNKGWLSGGSREDIPLQHVTSVRLDISRSIIAGLFFLLFGFVMLGAEGGFKFIGFSLLALAFVLLWGSPLVVVNTAGRDLNAAKGWPWQRKNAAEFVEALRTQLFNRSET
ncbi:hypothetical protein [Xanthomonas translucens]|uniref:hypothetical protein n=1 Tax=Xanthomonas campestris pv. translucens TaxID=343 RepID=UPI00114D1B9D|nr:hypothetical protein [Xanthomonas translucens]QSQ51477.1 hypothetical protein ISN36_11780 [Xanthomonas translucens pv. undulosa]QSQ59607.1 hypothetical protein ISN38_15980 [Xanthomonas translucens pv. undulosa]